MLGIELEKTPIYQEIFAEGEQAGEAKVLLKQLAHRFGDLSGGTAATIARLSVEQLDQLTVDLLGFQSIEDLETWLAESGNWWKYFWNAS